MEFNQHVVVGSSTYLEVGGGYSSCVGFSGKEHPQRHFLFLVCGVMFHSCAGWGDGQQVGWVITPHTTTLRHDGSPWAKAAGGQELLRGVLTTLRGDWDFYHNCMKLPGWRNLQICWWCSLHLDDLADPASGMPIASPDFFKSARGTGVASILGAPAASTSTISVDWMHCVELGVGQDMVANVFWELLHKDGPVIQGANFAARLERLNASLRAYNARAKPKNPISVLTKKMLKQTGQSPKLKSKAAECRGSQGFALELAMEMARLDPSEHNILVLQCVDALVACSAVVTALPFNLAEFQRLGHHFLDSCHQLHAWGEEDNVWRIKPKHHMFKHMLVTVAPAQGSPALYWNWTDESLGGKFAKMALSLLTCLQNQLGEFFADFDTGFWF